VLFFINKPSYFCYTAKNKQESDMQKASVFNIRDESLLPAMKSAQNIYYRAIDFMYGSEERTKLTYAFALGLLILGVFIGPSSPEAMGVCAQ